MTNNVVRNQQHEAIFNSWNLKYRLIEDQVIESILSREEAQVRGIANIAIPINVDMYALQMQSGADFPPVILWNGILIDGNTRLAAAKKVGRATLPAYSVELPSVAMARALAAVINNTGAQRLTPEESRKQALNLIELEFTDAQIALCLGITAESARQQRRLVQVAERAERTGTAEQVGKMSKTIRMELGKLHHDQPFRDLALAIAAAKPDVKDVRQVVEQVRAATSDDAAVAVVDEARREWTPIGPEPAKHRANRPAQQARMHIGGLLKFSAAELVDTSKVDADADRWTAVAALANDVLALLHAQEAA